MPETRDAFGEAHVFELRGLLTEEFGSNLRNRLAHGLLDEGDCYSESVLHLWWLLLRLCVVPLIAESAPPVQELSSPQSPSETS
jgi:uncharacterized protein DUF4209